MGKNQLCRGLNLFLNVGLNQDFPLFLIGNQERKKHIGPPGFQ